MANNSQCREKLERRLPFVRSARHRAQYWPSVMWKPMTFDWRYACRRHLTSRIRQTPQKTRSTVRQPPPQKPPNTYAIFGCVASELFLFSGRQLSFVRLLRAAHYPSFSYLCFFCFVLPRRLTKKGYVNCRQYSDRSGRPLPRYVRHSILFPDHSGHKTSSGRLWFSAPTSR